MLKNNNYGPYGPQGPWTMGPMGPRGLGPNHFSSLSQNYFVFSGFWASQKKKMRYFMKIGIRLWIFAMLANVDLNLRLEICKIAI